MTSSNKMKNKILETINGLDSDLFEQADESIAGAVLTALTYGATFLTDIVRDLKVTTTLKQRLVDILSK